MRRLLPALAVLLVSALGLSACGTSDYCQTVQDNQKVLNGKATASNAALKRWADVMDMLRGQAPDDVKGDYKVLVSTARDVLDAQEKAGISLEELAKKPALVSELTQAERDMLNKAYNAFSRPATSDERNSVYTNIKQECEITLK